MDIFKHCLGLLKGVVLLSQCISPAYKECAVRYSWDKAPSCSSRLLEEWYLRKLMSTVACCLVVWLRALLVSKTWCKTWWYCWIWTLTLRVMKIHVSLACSYTQKLEAIASSYLLLLVGIHWRKQGHKRVTKHFGFVICVSVLLSMTALCLCMHTCRCLLHTSGIWLLGVSSGRYI